MPRLSWNEIQDRAVQFAAEWAGETYEKGESQSFWSGFLYVFGIDRRRHGAFFEYPVKKLSGKQGFIDLFWTGKLIAEQKSAGRDLDKATTQAFDYLDPLPDHDLPTHIVVSDFATFQLIELETMKKATFPLAELPQKVKWFSFLVDETGPAPVEEDPVNRQAAERMAALHNNIEASRYTGHDLEMLLVRLVFCLFADDALIFEKGTFDRYIRNRTSVDGSDVGPHLNTLFQVLDTPPEQRYTTLDQDLAAFPYINGALFREPLRAASWNRAMRGDLLAAAGLNWHQVSPAIFGSMFQGVMDATERRNLGAHYTSERNILRVIKPLFLDDLYAEYTRVRTSKTQLEKFHRKLATLNFLDPACGCGNFLVITYRELRRLEHKVVQDLLKGQRVIDVASMLRVNVSQMHGIEIEEFPSLIAQTALWLTDHQMNLEASTLLGRHYTRLPLTASANIVNANALTTDWADVIAPENLNYILGNPPFVGKQNQSTSQKKEMAALFTDVSGAKELDFVSAWYVKSMQLMKSNPAVRTALVSTNSITQGEQVGILWKYLIDNGATINFAHRTFRWTNEAPGIAAVYCVIVGFGLQDVQPKRLFDYPDIREDPIEYVAEQINPYLVDAPTVFVASRRRPLNASALPMRYGSKPVDGGHYMFTDEEKEEFLVQEPVAQKFFRRLIGSKEYINGISRWCLWLADASPSELRQLPKVRERIARVQEFRAASKKEATRRDALTPARFAEMRYTEGDYLAIPETSSENRIYIPVGIVESGTIANNSIYTLPNPDLYHLGVLLSAMHMAWTRVVCGRLKSDYRYSSGLVYNNLPWPDATDAQKTQIERLAQGVLDARANYPDSTLADLYDPLTMPPDLRRAHEANDRAVDRLYRSEPFESDAERVAHLFTLFQQMTDSGKH